MKEHVVLQKNLYLKTIFANATALTNKQLHEVHLI